MPSPVSYTHLIISNATDGLRDGLARYGLLDAFDLVVGSAYEGIMKPHPAIYERCLLYTSRCV